MLCEFSMRFRKWVTEVVSRTDVAWEGAGAKSILPRASGDRPSRAAICKCEPSVNRYGKALDGTLPQLEAKLVSLSPQFYPRSRSDRGYVPLTRYVCMSEMKRAVP